MAEKPNLAELLREASLRASITLAGLDDFIEGARRREAEHARYTVETDELYDEAFAELHAAGYL